MKSIFTKKENMTHSHSLLKRVAIPVLGIAMGWILEAVPAQADTINIANFGFENDSVTNGVFSTTTPPDWQLYNPSNIAVANGLTSGFSAAVGTFVTPAEEKAPEGQKVGFTFLTPPLGNVVLGLQQTLATTLSANTNYMLNVGVGNTPGNDGSLSYLLGFPGYQVELLAGGNVIATDNNTLSPAEGEFLTSTISYTASANNPYLGQQLGIRLVGLNGAGSQVDFDNVRLTATPVPESNAILGILLATGIGYGIKRKSTQPVKIS